MNINDYRASLRLSKTKPRSVDFSGLGLVGFKRSHRAKRLILRIKPSAEIIVSVPRGISLNEAVEFVKSKIDWIKRIKDKINFRNNRKKRAKILPIEDAKSIIIKRVYELSDIYGFSFGKIRIKNQKTIWGSCSAKNNLNFNYKIASLPSDLRDYVILHELVHTRVKNHGKKFWTLLGKYISNPKILRKALKKIQYEYDF